MNVLVPLPPQVLIPPQTSQNLKARLLWHCGIIPGWKENVLIPFHIHGFSLSVSRHGELHYRCPDSQRMRRCRRSHIEPSKCRRSDVAVLRVESHPQPGSGREKTAVRPITIDELDSCCARCVCVVCACVRSHFTKLWPRRWRDSDKR